MKAREALVVGLLDEIFRNARRFGLALRTGSGLRGFEALASARIFQVASLLRYSDDVLEELRALDKPEP